MSHFRNSNFVHEAMSLWKEDIYVEGKKVLDTLLVISFGLSFINVHLSKAEISEKYVTFNN